MRSSDYCDVQSRAELSVLAGVSFLRSPVAESNSSESLLLSGSTAGTGWDDSCVTSVRYTIDNTIYFPDDYTDIGDAVDAAEGTGREVVVQSGADPLSGTLTIPVGVAVTIEFASEIFCDNRAIRVDGTRETDKTTFGNVGEIFFREGSAGSVINSTLTGTDSSDEYALHILLRTPRVSPKSSRSGLRD